MLLTTSYISKSQLRANDAISVVNEIVATSIARNGALGITGALLFSGTHFAQILEGPSAEVGHVMDSILADQRHRDIVVLSRQEVASRRFQEWALAYCGPSPFLTRHLEQFRIIHAQSDRSEGARRLSEMLLEFSRQNRFA